MADRQGILVIDDTKANLEAAVRQFHDPLIKYQFELVTARNFDEGVDAIEKQKFDIVMSDLMMPKGTDRVMNDKGMPRIFEQMPLGFPLALYAAKKEVPLICVLTDMGHHDHPIAYSLDHAGGIYSIDHSLVYFGAAPMTDFEGKRVKDWAYAMADFSRRWESEAKGIHGLASMQEDLSRK